MMREQEYFIHLLSDFINEQQTPRSDNLDWNIIRNLSRIHQVEGIVYYQCKNYIDKENKATFEKAFHTTLLLYFRREKLVKKIINEFSQNNISSFEIKGLEVAKYYPLPYLRSMGDSDIVIHQEDIECADSILLGLGFSHKYEFLNKERGYVFNNIEIELHHKLIYDEIITQSIQQNAFNNCWQYVNDRIFFDSFHFLFLLVHLRKHMLNEGAGFRQFMDIAMFIKNDTSLNWDWITEQLRELKLEQFAHKCFGVIDFWFGVKAPISFLPLEDSFKEQATKTILHNGVFGFNNIANKSKSISNRMRIFKGPRWVCRFLIVLESVFPNYEFLKAGDSYLFLNGRPWLLPVAWCYRLFLMCRGKTTDAGNIMRLIMTPDNIIKSREKELKKWGLID